MQSTTCRTVKELIDTLSQLDQESTPISHEGPFTGVRVIPQESGNVLIASLWNTDEGRDYRSVQNEPLKL